MSGDFEKRQPDAATTRIGSREFSRRGEEGAGAFAVWGLTVLWHPQVERVGERAVLSRLEGGRQVALSRLEPLFAAPDGRALPLADPRLSRRPLELHPGAGGGLSITRGDCSSALQVEGAPLDGRRELSAAQLKQGVVLTLGHAVVLLLHRLDPQLDRGLPRWGLVGESLGLVAVRRAISQVADLEVPVLVRGATGTGKELVARAIHDASPRRRGPFVAVNMAAVPAELAAAELFGAERGAFTGADRRRPGWFVEAQGGTLFLDEIGETPEAVQPLLLRALDSGEVQPVGAGAVRRVDVRLVAATDADLERRVEQNRFRAPLLHRLRGFEIQLPSLAERRDDLGRLLVTFLTEELARIGEPYRLTGEAPWLPAAVVERFALAAWPGNVRQLRAAVRQLVISNRGSARAQLDPGLEAQLTETSPGAEEGPRELARPPTTNRRRGRGRRPADVNEEELVAALRASRFRPQAAAEALGLSRASIYDLIARSRSLRTAAALTAEVITAAAEVHGGHVDSMAAALEVSASALRRRMKQLGFSAPPPTVHR